MSAAAVALVQSMLVFADRRLSSVSGVMPILTFLICALDVSCVREHVLDLQSLWSLCSDVPCSIEGCTGKFDTGGDVQMRMLTLHWQPWGLQALNDIVAKALMMMQ